MKGTLAVYRGLLQNRPLTRLLAGEFISSVGDWLYLVALLIVVDEQTGDPFLLGLVGALRVLPYVILSIPAGIVADRFDRRLVLIGTDLVRGSLMIVMAAVVATGGHWLAIVVLSTLATCFSSFFGPTIGAYLPSLARDERELGPANSAWSTLDNLAFIVGPGLAFVLVAAFDVTWAFLINAGSFAVCAVILWGIPSIPRAARAEPATPATPPVAAAPEPSTGPIDAPPTVRRLARPIGGLIAIDVAAGFVFGGIGILTVILAEDVFSAGTEATGLLNAAIGIGGLIGAVASSALIVRRRLAGPFLGGVVALGLGVGLLGVVGGIEIALVAMVVLAAGDLVREVASTTIFQRIVPDEIRGRTLGVRETLGMIAYAAGAFALPVLAVQLGVAPVLLTAGGAVVACGLLAMVLLGAATTAEPPPLPFDVRRIAGLPVFAGVPAARLDDILGRLSPVTVATGDVIIREGDVPDRFYIIDRGSFDVSQVDEAGGDRHLRTMGPDEVFGEIGLITGRPRSATVAAESDGLLLALDASDFAELVALGPGLGNRLLDLHRGAAATWLEEATPAVSPG